MRTGNSESKQSSSTRDTADPSRTPITTTTKHSARYLRLKHLHQLSLPGSSERLKRDNPNRYDIVFVGGSGTGKTTLLRKIKGDTKTPIKPSGECVETFMVRKKENPYYLNMLDISGRDEVTKLWIKTYTRAIVFYHDANSYQQAENYLAMLKETGRINKDTVLLLFNPSPILSEQNCTDLNDQGSKLAKDRGCEFVEKNLITISKEDATDLVNNKLEGAIKSQESALVRLKRSVGLNCSTKAIMSHEQREDQANLRSLSRLNKPMAPQVSPESPNEKRDRLKKAAQVLRSARLEHDFKPISNHKPTTCLSVSPKKMAGFGFGSSAIGGALWVALAVGVTSELHLAAAVTGIVSAVCWPVGLVLLTVGAGLLITAGISAYRNRGSAKASTDDYTAVPTSLAVT